MQESANWWALKVCYLSVNAWDGELIGLKGLLPVCDAGGGKQIGLNGLLSVCYAESGELIG